jgi:hypothetical protein
MNSRDWKANGCRCVSGDPTGRLQALETHLIALTLEPRSRDVGQAQRLLCRAFWVSDNEGIARKNTFDCASELRHYALKTNADA